MKLKLKIEINMKIIMIIKIIKSSEIQKFRIKINITVEPSLSLFFFSNFLFQHTLNLLKKI